VSAHEGVHIELEVVVHLWVDLDPSAPPQLEPGATPTEASIIAGQMRGVPLGMEALAAIAAAYEADILDEARAALDHLGLLAALGGP
jgi:hypothetical protein